MSGTSLDGLDIADVTFSHDVDNNWTFNLNNAQTIPYDDHMRKRLFEAPKSSAENIHQLSVELSQFYGEKINELISTNKIDKNEILAVASHGQTIFHQPERKMTVQIGNTPHLSAITGLKSVVDFRTRDVALGGNGAPLIPVVDHTLFSDLAEGFLNLGGFSNLSFKRGEVVRSFDVGPANIVINHLVHSEGLVMDEDGRIARSGKLDRKLFEQLESLEYYNVRGPKSLGWEWVEKDVLPLFKKDIPLKDKLATYNQHMSGQLIDAMNEHGVKSVMITGGGAHNKFLLDTIKSSFQGDIILPDTAIIDFKEAIGFAFIGLLRCLNEVNVLCSVTGAQKDSCSGVIYEP
jgi:anhydro-N-acetylmuramic acid kinase